MRAAVPSRVATRWLPVALLVAGFAAVAVAAPAGEAVPALLTAVLVAGIGLLAVAVGTGDARDRTRPTRGPGFEIDTVAVLRHTDPDAPGHIRARAPGLRIA